MMDCLQNIQSELKHAIDKHSRTLIVSNIELLLNYSTRFYERQFITRNNVNRDMLAGFERLLGDYFAGDRPERDGVPSVRWCAEQLHLSANYFGDLVKKETGKSAQEYIQLKVIDIAKERIFDPGRSISEIAYSLGFRYPQHFTRLFKKVVGWFAQRIPDRKLNTKNPSAARNGFHTQTLTIQTMQWPKILVSLFSGQRSQQNSGTRNRH